MNNVKEKIDNMAPLSAGIVFGKEEAWDKLQARMDKPARRIALRPWLAAAAMLLLLFVTVLLTLDNNTPVQKVVKNDLPQQTINANNTGTTTTGQQLLTVEKSKPAITHKAIKHTKKEQTQTTQPQPEEIQMVQAPVVEKPVIENAAPIVNAPVAAVSKIPTKVVHINEVNSRNYTPEIETTNMSHTSVKLRVVHIHDVEREEFTIQNMLRENNPGLGQLYSRRTQFIQNNNKINIDNDYYPDNPLRIQINLQN